MVKFNLIVQNIFTEIGNSRFFLLMNYSIKMVKCAVKIKQWIKAINKRHCLKPTYYREWLCFNTHFNAPLSTFPRLNPLIIVRVISLLSLSFNTECFLVFSGQIFFKIKKISYNKQKWVNFL